jgi:hypothetical protein
MQIAEYLPNGSIAVISRDRAPSSTTKNHLRILHSAIRHKNVVEVRDFSGAAWPVAHAEFESVRAEREAAVRSRRAQSAVHHGLVAAARKTKKPSHEYELLVGSLGTVLRTKKKEQAEEAWREYVAMSKEGVGRAAGEDVTLMQDGEPMKEHYGTMDPFGATPSASRAAIRAIKHESGGNPHVYRGVKDSALKARVSKLLGKK